MPHDVIMPALGMAQDTGLIVSWLKKPGDKVSAGEPLMEVETDKATMEVEASHDGFLADVRAAAGEDVPVGNVVAVIRDTPDAPAASEPAPDPAADAGDTAKSDGRQHEVIMPALGMAQDSGRILGWLKATGDTVRKGDPLFEVETDKSTVEVEASADGQLAAIYADAGSEVPVGEVIAIISADGSAGAPPPIASSPATARPAAAPPAARTQQATAPAQSDAARAAPAREGSVDGRVLASPKARRLASERGLDLKALFAGNDGRPIHVKDLDRLAQGVAAAAPRDQAARPSPATAPAALPQRIEASVAVDGLGAFFDFLSGEGEPPARSAVFALLAAGALRAATKAHAVAITMCPLGCGPHGVYADPDRRLQSPTDAAPGGSAAPLVLRDLTATSITAMSVSEGDTPVLAVTQHDGRFAVALSYREGALEPAAALGLVEGFVARLDEPMRQIL